MKHVLHSTTHTTHLTPCNQYPTTLRKKHWTLTNGSQLLLPYATAPLNVIGFWLVANGIFRKTVHLAAWWVLPSPESRVEICTALKQDCVLIRWYSYAVRTFVILLNISRDLQNCLSSAAQGAQQSKRPFSALDFRVSWKICALTSISTSRAIHSLWSSRKLILSMTSETMNPTTRFLVDAFQTSCMAF